MSHGIDVARSHSLAGREARCHLNVASGRYTFRNQYRHFFGCQRRLMFRGSSVRPTAPQLCACNQTRFKHQFGECHDPSFVVAHPKIFQWRYQLALESRGVEIPFTPGAHCARNGIASAFPWLMEYGLVLHWLNRSHTVHPAHIVDAVHAVPPSAGGATFATPTIASLVTNVSNSASLIFSVPDGRSGSTK